MLNTQREELRDFQEHGPIGKLRLIVKYIRHSPQRRKEFLDIAGSTPRLDGKELMVIECNTTRWNSTYIMIQRAVKVRDRLEAYYAKALLKRDLPFAKENILTSDDWVILTWVLEALQPMHNLTLQLEQKNVSGTHGSLSDVIPTLEYLLGKMEDARDRRFGRVAHDEDGEPDHLPDEEEHIGTAANNAWEKLNTYYQKTDDSFAYVAALVMNPNLKFHYIEHLWKHKQSWISTSKKNLTSAYAAWVEHEAKLWIKTTSASSSVASSSPPVGSSERTTTGFLNYTSWKPAAKTINHRSQQAAELTSYLSNNTRQLFEKGRDQSGNSILETPIEWWFAHKEVYPTLSHFALTILSIPGMSAEVERVFSSSALLITDRRSNLKEDVIEASECLRSWHLNNVIR